MHNVELCPITDDGSLPRLTFKREHYRKMLLREKSSTKPKRLSRFKKPERPQISEQEFKLFPVPLVRVTDTLCHHCTLSFSGVPFMIPTKRCGSVVMVKGCYCSAECAKAVMHDKRCTPTQLAMFQTIARRVYKLGWGTPPDKPLFIHRAPPKEALEKFGGPLSETGFREMCKQVDTIEVPNNLIPIGRKFMQTDVGPCDAASRHRLRKQWLGRSHRNGSTRRRGNRDKRVHDILTSEERGLYDRLNREQISYTKI